MQFEPKLELSWKYCLLRIHADYWYGEAHFDSVSSITVNQARNDCGHLEKIVRNVFTKISKSLGNWN